MFNSFQDVPSFQSKGREGSHCRTRAVTATGSHSSAPSGGPRRSTETAATRGKYSVAGARRAAASTAGGTQTGSLVIRDSVDPAEAKVFRAHAMPQVRARISCVL